MRRTDRLFEILQLFRSRKLLLGREIADKLEVSVRTIYRDIDTLVASGIPIEGERGVGYILREPIFLPPLALTPEELQALNLGQTGDAELSGAADSLLVKLNAVAPGAKRGKDPLRDISVYASEVVAPTRFLLDVRRAIAERRVIEIDYETGEGHRSTRRIRPLQTEYWGKVWTCPAWCELKEAFRAFRVDRITSLTFRDDQFSLEPGTTYRDYLAQVPIEEWRAAQ